MSGVFAQWQPEYAAHGIATFPVDEKKTPSIRGWQKVGHRGSAQLAAKFTNADALGYVTGRRSNVTVLDIDTTDEKVAEDAIERHGRPIIITRTASGKFHHLYRYNGEPRRIRPLPALPIDLLGDNGYALAAPSKIATGCYEIIHGHLDDLDRLTPMVADWGEMRAVARGAPREHVDANAPLRGMREHDGRNQALFMALGPIARTVHQSSGTRGELLDIAQKQNARCDEPMGDAEVNRIVDSIWNMTQAGRNVIGLPDAFCLTVDHLDIEDPYAFKLLAFLRAHQGPGALFMCANGLAERFGWDRRRLAQARHTLIVLGYLKSQRQAGRGNPALFRWGQY